MKPTLIKLILIYEYNIQSLKKPIVEVFVAYSREKTQEFKLFYRKKKHTQACNIFGL